MTKDKIELLDKIGHFFLKEKEDYQETERFLRLMEITQIERVSSHKIVILLRRPGMLIGKKGQRLEALEKHLNLKIQIVEDTNPSLYDFLIPQE